MFLSHLTALRTLLSGSSNFQTWTGAADATAALDYIYLGLEAPSGQTRVALLGVPEGGSWQSDMAGPGVAAGSQERHGRLTLVRYIEGVEDMTTSTVAESFLAVCRSIYLDILNGRGSTSTPEDTHFDNVRESLSAHLLPHDEDAPALYPQRLAKDGGGQAYLVTLDFTWRT